MTPKQLTKSIEATEKAIEKAKKNIAMYEKRRDNAIAKANKKGYDLTLDSFEIYEEFIPTSYDCTRGYVNKTVRPVEELPFDLHCSIINPWESMYQNQSILQREELKLSDLKSQLASINTENQVVSDMASILEKSMQEFKTQWFAKMINWHMAHHAHINAILADTTTRHNRMVDLRKRMERQYGFWMCRSKYELLSKRHGTTFYRLKQAIRKANDIISDKAAGKTETEYKAMANEMISNEWSSNMKVLVEKLDRFHINLNAVKVEGIDVTEKGFECFITDGGNRRIYARLIWAAEYSVMVAPHTRYIVTEKHQ